MEDANPYESPPESPLTAPEGTQDAGNRKTPPRRVCGAKKRDGTACRAPAMPNGRCRIHGGLTPSGPALPQYKTGRYSRWLSDAMRPDFDAALTETSDLLDGTEDLALLHVKITERLRQLSEGEIPAWAEVGEAVAELKSATRARDTAAISAAVHRLSTLAERGAGSEAAWSDIRRLLQERRKIGAQETARRARLLEYVEGNKHRQAMRLLAATVTECIDELPGLAAALVRTEGVLNTEKLRYALLARIGRRLKEVAPLLYPRPGETIEKRGI